MSEGPIKIEAQESRYFAIFKSGNMELENSSNDLPAIKAWVANLFKDHPSPDYVMIRDQEEDKDIFEERNPA